MILWFYGIGVIAGGMLLPGMLKLLGQRIGLMACLAGLMFNFGLFHSDFFSSLAAVHISLLRVWQYSTGNVLFAQSPLLALAMTFTGIVAVICGVRALAISNQIWGKVFMVLSAVWTFFCSTRS